MPCVRHASVVSQSNAILSGQQAEYPQKLATAQEQAAQEQDRPPSLVPYHWRSPLFRNWTAGWFGPSASGERVQLPVADDLFLSAIILLRRGRKHASLEAS
jgi:hypothetical protein